MNALKIVYTLPMIFHEIIAVNPSLGEVAFQNTLEKNSDMTVTLSWVIVEWDGAVWKRVTPTGKEILRNYLRERFRKDRDILQTMITTLMYTLLKLHEHEDGEHAVWVME